MTIYVKQRLARKTDEATKLSLEVAKLEQVCEAAMDRCRELEAELSTTRARDEGSAEGQIEGDGPAPLLMSHAEALKSAADAGAELQRVKDELRLLVASVRALPHPLCLSLLPREP